MQLNITARHIDLTPALSDYVHRKVEKAQRFADSIVWAQTILSVEKHRHMAEFVVHTPGHTFRTKGEAGDLYSAVDVAAHKLDLLLSRNKDKQRNHRKAGSKESPRAKPLVYELSSEPIGNGVNEVSRILLEPRSLTRAIRDLEGQRLPFLLFINERTNQISVVYKKGKEGYGLVEAEV